LRSCLRESPMCPNDLTPNCVLHSPSTTTHIASRAKGKSEAAKSRPYEEAACVPKTQSVATVNLSVFRRHPYGASALSSACKSA
jgi:hypothetical protein